MAWNAPGGDNNSKDPWKDNKSQTSDLEKRINDTIGRFTQGGGFGASSILLFLAVLLVLYTASSFYVVDEQERGVVLRFGKYHETVGSGWHWNPKLIDEVNIINVTQVATFTDKVTMLTEDQNIVDVELSVQYRIANPEDYWLQIKDPANSLKEATEAALRHVVGTSKMDKVLTTGKLEVSNETLTLLREYMAHYRTGIVVDRVNIQDAQPPQAVKAAFEDVVKAVEDKESIINQAKAYSNGLLPEARGEAQGMLEAAEGYKQKLIAEAEGESQRFDSLLVEYTKAPRVTRERLYLEAVESVMDQSTKVMVDVKGGNNMMYLPLDKILQGQSSAPSASQKAEVTRQIKEAVDSQISTRGSREREVR